MRKMKKIYYIKDNTAVKYIEADTRKEAIEKSGMSNAGILRCKVSNKYKAFLVYLNALQKCGDIRQALIYANEKGYNGVCNYPNSWYDAVNEARACGYLD